VLHADYRTQIMNEDGQRAWIKHAGGSSRLVSCRGPSRFNTDFECALLHAQLPPLVSFGMILLKSPQFRTNTYVKITKDYLDNEPCFLDTGPWQEVMVRCNQLSIDNHLSIDSEYSWPGRVRMIHLLARLPRIHRDLTDFLASSKAIDSMTADSVRGRLAAHHAAWHDWFLQRTIEPPFTTSTTASSQHEPLYTARFLGRSWSLPGRHGHRWCNFTVSLLVTTMGLLSLEHSPLLIEECIFLANEYLCMLEYIKRWAPGKAISLSAGLVPTQAGRRTAQEWSRDETYTVEGNLSAYPFRRKIPFQKWQKWLTAIEIKS
jgi:hypothetical protein